jgi:hypothetical protein
MRHLLQPRAVHRIHLGEDLRIKWQLPLERRRRLGFQPSGIGAENVLEERRTDVLNLLKEGFRTGIDRREQRRARPRLQQRTRLAAIAALQIAPRFSRNSSLSPTKSQKPGCRH